MTSFCGSSRYVIDDEPRGLEFHGREVKPLRMNGRVAPLAALLALALSPATAGEVASSWATGHASRVRLVAGTDHADPARRLAGLQIRLSTGWKTYWRHPGESGGVPPRFDWTGSENLKSATVLFPAPQRLPDALGDSIGYKHDVDLPIRIEPRDPAQPMSLKLSIEFGVCREICVPAEAKLEIDVPADAPPVAMSVSDALKVVPRSAKQRLPKDPRLISATAALSGAAPGILFEVEAPGGAATADLFVEAPPGIYLAVPKRVGVTGDKARFLLDLSGTTEASHLPGKTLVITMTSASGATETSWQVK